MQENSAKFDPFGNPISLASDHKSSASSPGLVQVQFDEKGSTAERLPFQALLSGQKVGYGSSIFQK
jgi:hypothetical protein